MNLLVEIGHPAHVHFFKNPIRLLEKRGWNPIIAARDKAETLRLLQDEGFDYLTHSVDSTNLRKALGLIPGSFRMYKITKKYGIDTIAGISPVFSAVAKQMTRVPLTCFTDTDSAIEQIMIFTPNATTIHTPRPFRHNLGKKQKRYPGFHELSYLHPSYFKPNRARIEDVGLLDNGPPIVLRIIRWSATHDFGVHRTSWESEFVEKYSKDYTIVISSEGEIPKQFQKYANPLEPSDLHHLLAHSRLYIGAGGSTASESAMLGVPAIYTNPLPAGIFTELQNRYRLVYHLSERKGIMTQASEVLGHSLQTYQNRRKRLLEECVDVASYVAGAIESSVENS